MRYGFQPVEAPVGASVVEVTETGYVQGVAYIQSNKRLGTYLNVEEDVFWTGQTFSTEDEAIAAAIASVNEALEKWRKDWLENNLSLRQAHEFVQDMV